MNSTSTLTGSHLHTYNAIFQHPISHNLEWRAVRLLLANLADVVQESNGNLKVIRNGEVLVLHPPRTKDVTKKEEIMSLRHFLERSEISSPETKGEEAHWLLVIDHHEARIFRHQMHGGIPDLLLPHAPKEYFRHAHNSKGTSRGKEKPDPTTFFEPIAQALGDSGQILVFSTGTGASSEMDQFTGWAKRHHPELSLRIIGSLVVDEHHLTDDQLLAKARDFYASPQMLGA